jgi:hypothetical protein
MGTEAVGGEAGRNRIAKLLIFNWKLVKITEPKEREK